MEGPAPRPRLLLADDQVLLLDAFRALLEPEFDVIASVCTEHDLIAACTRLKPDAVVLDVRTGWSGLERRLRALSPRTKVIVLTDDEAAPAANGGAVYVRKSSPARALKLAVRDAVHEVAKAGEFGGLTSRQVEVLQLLAQGLSMKEVADRLHVTPRTVAFHKYSIMRHLRLTTTAELVQFAMKHGLVHA